MKLWNNNSEKCVDIYQHWLAIGEDLARCNLDQIDVKQVEDELQMAVCLETVKDTELTRPLWENRDSRTNLEKHPHIIGGGGPRVQKTPFKITSKREGGTSQQFHKRKRKPAQLPVFKSLLPKLSKEVDATSSSW